MLLREYIKSLIVEKIETDEPSTMIAAYPDQKSIDNIVKFQNSIDFPKGIKVLPADELHCTIRYWKGDRKLEDILPFMHSLEFGKIECKISKLDFLGEAVVLMLDCPALHKVFNKIDKGIQKEGVPPSDYPEFKAHLSLCYGEDIDLDLSKIKVPFESITFSEIRVVNEDDDLLWKSSSV